MGVFKSISNSLVGIWKDVRELKEMQDPKALEKARKYDELKKLVPNLKVSVERIIPSINAKGNTELEIVYSIPHGKIEIDENGNSETDKLVYALNFLDVLSFDDQMRIKEAREIQEDKKIKK